MFRQTYRIYTRVARTLFVRLSVTRLYVVYYFTDLTENGAGERDGIAKRLRGACRRHARR